ncbi:PQQ-binding-like beta-propeller repeat protein [Aequorivita lipolytica]|uniref:PQQ-binding-like beta-propeller repeat protein n=1 Tax=Aequorivita lipolytica TaxID=153267 RepID=A0A5C6YTI2_9FLAO|nr:PQQ-binding-like beta-propeller repeat protein [Aequorivita lipolytica]TXD70831.1 PQQ-binding-like beta-propeller repeat protein [Aequorivita lipolytica]SRX49879.1 Outer membrane protein assembly factor BamB [Aequorivita lipolytica]
MKTSIFFYTLICFAFITQNPMFAQKAEQPDFRYDTGAKINEMSLTQGGTMVVATNDGLVGIKPGSNQLLFNFTEYGRVKPEELTFIPNAPYVIIYQGGFANLSSKKTVIDYISGKTLFSTESNGWKDVITLNVMMPQNKLVVSGNRTSKEKYAQQVAVYDLNTGKEDYRFDIGEPGRVGIAKTYMVTGIPLLLKNSLVVPTSQGVFNMKAQTGELIWQNDMKNMNALVADVTETEIYAFEQVNQGKNTRIHKLSVNGAELWKDDHKVKGQVVNFQILPKGIAVVSNQSDGGSNSVFAPSNESNISFLSATNGEDLWDKAPKTKGYVQHFYVMEDGILFGIYQGGINKISFEGETLFKKPLKTGENILTMAHTPQGLIYITTEDANIVDLETGEQVWNKPLKYKRADAVSSTLDKKNNRYLISVDDELFAVDATSGEVSTLAESKFDGKEAPTHVEIRDGGILLTSDQNMLLMDWKGANQWQEYYRAPGKSAMGAIIAGVAAVASMAAATAAANSSMQNKLAGYDSQSERDADLAGGMAVAAGASISEMLKRFKATAATQNDQFILTKLEDGVGLVKVNKDTGKKEKEIVLKDKQPEYLVDEIGGILYYKADNNSIFAYDLTK